MSKPRRSGGFYGLLAIGLELCYVFHVISPAVNLMQDVVLDFLARFVYLECFGCFFWGGMGMEIGLLKGKGLWNIKLTVNFKVNFLNGLAGNCYPPEN